MINCKSLNASPASALLSLAISTACLIGSASPASAHDERADDHAPIGVMADHAHKKGEIMLSLRYMHMDMSGNQIGTDSVSPDEIATSVPNRFFGQPMQPPTLRVVPTSMRTDMVMFGAMYAPSDAFTLIAMGNYTEKEMTHLTYAGAAGTNIRGEFVTRSKDFGDITLGAIVPLLGVADNLADQRYELNLRAALSLPTGADGERDTILTPMGGTPDVRLPYPMQIGSGSVDLKPGLTFKGWSGALGYGAQYAGTIRLERGDHGYRLGDRHEIGAWLSWMPAQWISLSGRVKGSTTGRIKGIDAQIIGPVQTANPDFHGGERLDLYGGINLVVTHGPFAGHRLGLELGVPVWQDLHGPQLGGDWMLTLGWQKAF